MKVFALASGSSGNCCFVRGEKTNILIDAGLSALKIASRLDRIGECIDEISAVFITHEHYDHISGLLSLVKRIPSIKIYAHAAVCKAVEAKYNLLANNLVEIKSSVLYYQEFLVNAFLLKHDSCACLGFSIYFGESKFSIVTDCGVVDDDIVEAVYDSNLIFLESNYSIDMLKTCPYCGLHKLRLKSETGHMSNIAAGEVIHKITNKRQEQGLSPAIIALAHLSQNSNNKETCEKEVKAYLKSKKVAAAFTAIERGSSSDIYCI